MEGLAQAQTTDSTAQPASQSDARKMGSPAKRAARQLNVLQEKLNLEPGQVQQLNIILLNQATAMDSLSADHPGNQRADMRPRRKILQNTDRQINALLNDDQKKLYQQWKAEQREQRGGGRRRRNAGGAAQE